MSDQHEDSMDEEFLDESKGNLSSSHLVVGIILELGNQILLNLGVKDKIDDVEVFLRQVYLS